MNGFLTTKELAMRWDMAEGTLRNWRHEKIGPPYKRLGEGTRSTILYDIEEIRKYELKHLKKRIS